MRIPAISAALLAACIGGAALPARAEPVLTRVAAPIDEVLFAVESAILDRGLVIDSVSHVGDMLARTGADVGSDRPLFTRADVFLFCSAILSRRVMEADLTNIAYCPYGIFVYESAAEPGVSVVGYRSMPEGPMKEVEALLAEIVAEATAR
ncbi:MAG: DUF302 domain-containing protein [Alphaproteobacteria bacterium]|nr:MAG: DUF302 domain-containing protein [Alphaproteobacteria bacterium]